MPFPLLRRPCPSLAGPLACALALLGLAGGAAAEDAVVTALEGTVRMDGAPVTLETGVASGALLASDDNARMALLAERDVLVELYGRTELSFASQPDGPPRVDALRGSFRTAVGTRPRSLRLQVRTPTARITPIGALAHVSIDPDNGETRVTCLEEKVLVHGLEGVSKRSVILNPGQQVTVRPGEGPGPIQKLGGQAEGGAPLLYGDQGFRIAALSAEQHRSGGAWRARIAALDMPSDDLPPVSSDRPAGLPMLSTMPRLDLDKCDPTTCDVLAIEIPAGPVEPPPSCPPNTPPGEQCQF